MTHKEALQKAMDIRKTSLSPSVTVSAHGDGSNGHEFEMFSLSIDGMTIAGEKTFEACFAEYEKRYSQEIDNTIKRLEVELESLKGAKAQ
jgi:hypothetical protein